jgi:HAMP domain-containing protein
MGLTTKFNIALLLTSALGLTLAGYFANQLLERNAREEVLLQAGIMMEAASAIRSYTVEEIRPLLTLQMKRQFLPQTVPAYAATKNITGMREHYADYTYKEATLNPTNPADRATDWEADVVEWFRNHPEQESMVGERDAVNGKSLYMARPIQITNPTCLACHSTPDKAPVTLVDLYGDSNGFGWKQDEIVGAQIVSVPMSVPLARAERAWRSFMIGLGAIFALVALVINLMLYFIVIRPVNRMARIADQVSKGQDDAPAFEVVGRDQIASLGRSFNRMRVSLGSAMQMLEQTMNGGEPAP